MPTNPTPQTRKHAADLQGDGIAPSGGGKQNCEITRRRRASVLLEPAGQYGKSPAAPIPRLRSPRIRPRHRCTPAIEPHRQMTAEAARLKVAPRNKRPPIIAARPRRTQASPSPRWSQPAAAPACRFSQQRHPPSFSDCARQAELMRAPAAQVRDRASRTCLRCREDSRRNPDLRYRETEAIPRHSMRIGARRYTSGDPPAPAAVAVLPQYRCVPTLIFASPTSAQVACDPPISTAVRQICPDHGSLDLVRANGAVCASVGRSVRDQPLHSPTERSVGSPRRPFGVVRHDNLALGLAHHHGNQFRSSHRAEVNRDPRPCVHADEHLVWKNAARTLY